MESLNDLIWNGEDIEVDPQNEDIPADFCMVSFSCIVETMGSNASCSQDVPQRAVSCILG